MRTYRKRASEVRQCVHCHTCFESNHKRRIYCGNSCSTLAYYARKAQAARPLTGLPAEPAPTLSPAAAEPTSMPPPVTLALNAQNLALLTAGPLLAEGLKQAAQFVGKLLAPAPHAGPSRWLPPLFRLLKQPLLPLLHPNWDEPRFFVPVPWKGTVFYYRAADDLLFWQAPGGEYLQLTREAEFQQLVTQLEIQLTLQQYVPTYQLATLPSLPALLPKDVG